MIRKAFVMTLKPGCQAEYEQRHNPIWPELRNELESRGVHNYSIFLNRETNSLFAYVELESEQLWQEIPRTEACRQWWAYMKDLMLTNADDSPLAGDLVEVFHLD